MSRTSLVARFVVGLALLAGAAAAARAVAPRAPAQTPTPAPPPTPAPAPAPASGTAAAQATPTPAEQHARRGQAMAKAVPYLLSVDPMPIHLPLLLDIIKRRYGVTRFDGMTERYDLIMKEARGQKLSRMRVLRRILDRQNRILPRDIEAIDITSIDGITSRALYCDKKDLPDDYVARLKTSMSESDYGATHAALALMWMKENGCPSPLTDEETQKLVERLAAIPTADGRVTDVEVEAATFLCCMGHADLLTPAFIDQVVAAQREDGSWPYDSVETNDRAHWHTSALALWLLLEVERGTKETMLPR
jgi:hypothetical protein